MYQVKIEAPQGQTKKFKSLLAATSFIYEEGSQECKAKINLYENGTCVQTFAVESGVIVMTNA